MNTVLASVRNNFRQRRKELSPQSCAQASQQITTKIIKSPVFSASKNIACYIPTENEIDTASFIKIIWQQQKNCYLPVVDPEQKRHLIFVKFNEGDSLAISKYGIPEPEINPEKIIAAKDLDLVIVPLVGFNSNNYRLGRGAGYYDITFSFKLRHSKQKPVLFGVAYAWQRVEFTPRPWDVPMEQIIVDDEL